MYQLFSSLVCLSEADGGCVGASEQAGVEETTHPVSEDDKASVPSSNSAEVVDCSPTPEWPVQYMALDVAPGVDDGHCILDTAFWVNSPETVESEATSATDFRGLQSSFGYQINDYTIGHLADVAYLNELGNLGTSICSIPILSAMKAVLCLKSQDMQVDKIQSNL